MPSGKPWYAPYKGSSDWIWHNDQRPRNDMALFYGRLTAPAGATRVHLAVSADNRYTLWVLRDGKPAPELPLGRGPARGDVQHKSLDGYDLPVTPGEVLHVYAQVRWAPGQHEAPMGEVHSSLPGLVLTALFQSKSGKVLARQGTDGSWLAGRCAGVELHPMPTDIGFMCIGMTEHYRSSGWPANWLSPDGVSADAFWKAAQTGAPPYYKRDPEMATSPNDRPWLIQRQIALPEQRPLRPASVRMGEGAGALVAGKAFPLVLQPGQTVRLLVDMGEMVLAYPSVHLQGRGTRVEMTWSEVLVESKQSRLNKSFDPASGYQTRGYTDSFELDTDRSASLLMAHWRSFRFVEIIATGGSNGGQVGAVEFEGTGYPLTDRSKFSVPGELGPVIDQFVDVSWRTLKCCTWETYMDCPFYEQMQYVGDTRLQCLITYVTTGDAALPAQALRAFDRSRMHEGLTQSRAPSTGMQLIPTFSLIYIAMIEDYLDWMGDDDLVDELRPGIPGIIQWFYGFYDQRSGLVETPPYWPFIDWVRTWRVGIPPGGSAYKGGPEVNASINLTLLLGLKAAARVMERNAAGGGKGYAKLADELTRAIRKAFWHAGTGLISETPVAGKPQFSQHAQALGVLTGVLKPDEGRRALAWAMDPAHLAPIAAADEPAKSPKPEHRLFPASFYFRYYLAEALVKCGMGDEVWSLLAPFREALARGSSTWPEAFEPCRSECHAWSSWPLYFFHRHVLGVQPDGRGAGGVKVAPSRCAPLLKASGVTMTAAGPVATSVDWTAGKRAKVVSRPAGKAKTKRTR